MRNIGPDGYPNDITRQIEQLHRVAQILRGRERHELAAKREAQASALDDAIGAAFNLGMDAARDGLDARTGWENFCADLDCWDATTSAQLLALFHDGHAECPEDERPEPESDDDLDDDLTLSVRWC